MNLISNIFTKNIFKAPLLFCGLLLILYMQRPQEQQFDIEATSAAPSWYAQDLQLFNYDTKGQLHNQWSVAQIQHYPQTKRSEIQQAHYASLPTPGAGLGYTLDADKATAYHGASLHHVDKIELRENVSLQQNNAANPNTLKTSQLDIFPATHIATSAAAIEFSRPHHKMTGIGLYADLKNGITKILSNVRGTHELSN